ncbi:CopG family transcriptional regulator [candidate division KSB3 bacterium]|uniref:CopG family transcriptional regulator n=1 Tax=candidate division KSB3 bacterium TaxID=2044937 RepID=A0A9D5K0J3_9BACT|nr:CopG family transcriptional regulator [candidate division KSB3 bacterium]MBD3327161.1 CopG family transcriptional regulator [candidate division KSB3 bacterium]
MKTLHAALPEKLYGEISVLIQEGWFHDEQELVREALQRYLDAHRPELMESCIRADVEWGLYGDD